MTKYDELPVIYHVKEIYYPPRREMRIFVGTKQIAYLAWLEPTAGGDPRWQQWHGPGKHETAGFTAEEAVAHILKEKGYTE